MNLMRTFPIMLNVVGRLATVVGGGPVGVRKVRSLLASGAKVRLIARTVDSPETPQPAVDLRLEPYRPELLEGSMLVFACTEDRALNSRIARDARRIGALVNAADQPEDCDFYVPSTASRDEVVLAVGTGGASPSLAAHLRKRLESALPEKIGPFTTLLGQIRQELRGLVQDERRRGEIMKRLSQDDVYLAFAAKGDDAVRIHLKQLLA
jgi:siroheme synthase-like protein